MQHVEISARSNNPTRPEEKNYSTHNLEATTAVFTLEPGAGLEDLLKTRSLASIFILVVLRWIDSRNRIANGRMHRDHGRDSHYYPTVSRRDAEGLRDQTQVYNSFSPYDQMDKHWQTTRTRRRFEIMCWIDELGSKLLCLNEFYLWKMKLLMTWFTSA